jgi:hypothetical protein
MKRLAKFFEQSAFFFPTLIEKEAVKQAIIFLILQR